jgi:hypothetical protein
VDKGSWPRHAAGFHILIFCIKVLNNRGAARKRMHTRSGLKPLFIVCDYFEPARNDFHGVAIRRIFLSLNSFFFINIGLIEVIKNISQK